MKAVTFVVVDQLAGLFFAVSPALDRFIKIESSLLDSVLEVFTFLVVDQLAGFNLSVWDSCQLAGKA